MHTFNQIIYEIEVNELDMRRERDKRSELNGMQVPNREKYNFHSIYSIISPL